MVCGSWPKQIRCDICRGHNRKSAPAIIWSCKLCDYDVCPMCSGMPPVAILPSPLPKRIDNVLAETCNNGMDLQTISLEGWSALHYAAVAGHVGAVRRLLDMKASHAAADSGCRTPLHWAVFAGQDEAVRALLEAGASTEATDSNGEVPLVLAPPEMVRHAFDVPLTRYERGLPALKVRVSGTSDADGVYVRRGFPRNGRQSYIRYSEPPWAISWDGKAWGIYKEQFRDENLRYRSKANTPLCPVEGWESIDDAKPVPYVTNAQPWQSGDALVKATPVKLRPQQLKDAAAELPPSEVPLEGPPMGMPPGMITLPPGITPEMLPNIVAEMVRRGDLPEVPPECVQQ